MSLSPVEATITRSENPVDVIERLAAVNEWSFDRDDDDEISISVAGGWTDYSVAFTWLPEMEALHVGCAFDLKVPAGGGGFVSSGAPPRRSAATSSRLPKRGCSIVMAAANPMQSCASAQPRASPMRSASSNAHFPAA